MENLNGRLITYFATDGLRLKGYLALAKNSQTTIIHIHGHFGNFYENDFIPKMAESYAAAGINFLCVNNRGHDGIAEAYQDKKVVYIGGAIEYPEQCILDIKGAIKYAEEFSTRIILQGHSFGCQKVLAYLVEAKAPNEFVLLSPADTYQLQSNYIRPATIPEQLNRIRREYSDRMDELLPISEFGENQPGAEYYIPISAKSFVSLFGGSLPELLRYEQPLKYYLKASGFVYYGGKDTLWTVSKTVVEQFFIEHLEDLTFYYYENGDHHFHGFETIVAGEIINWVNREKVH